MHRRRFLHVTSAAICSTMAGCSSLGQTTLHSPERTDEPDGAYWTFHDGGEQLLNAGLEYGTPFENGFVPLQFHTWHREGTHLESLRIELRFGRPAGGVPPDVYLDTFDSSPDPTINFSDDDSGATVLDIPDLGPVGRGSITLNFIVRPHGWLPDKLGVRIREKLSSGDTLSGGYVTVVDDNIPFVERQA